jgi:hypothetical protein
MDIGIAKRPRLQITPSREVYAYVVPEGDYPPLRNTLVRLFSPQHARRVWNSIGVHVSDAALTEWSRVQAELLERHLSKRYDHELPPGNTICVGPAFLHGTEQERIETLYHEAWHLIEAQHGVYRTNGIIAEGTATAAELLAGYRRDWPAFARWSTWDRTLYTGACDAVMLWMRRNGATHSDLLVPENRAVIEQEFLERLDYIGAESFPQALAATPCLVEERAMIKAHRDFKKAVRPPYAPNAIAAFRRLRAHRLADELKAQDMRPLEQHYARLARLKEHRTS